MLDIHMINIKKTMFFYEFYDILLIVMKITKKGMLRKASHY